MPSKFKEVTHVIFDMDGLLLSMIFHNLVYCLHKIIDMHALVLGHVT
jgi:hypothetical protein